MAVLPDSHSGFAGFKTALLRQTVSGFLKAGIFYPGFLFATPLLEMECVLRHAYEFDRSNIITML